MNYNIDQSQNANLQNYRFEMLNKRKNSRSVSKIAQGNPDNWKKKTRLIQKNYATKDLSILQYDVIFLSPDFLKKLRGFSKSFAYVGSVAKGNIG